MWYVLCYRLTDKTVKDYAIYKPYLIFFGLIDGLYQYIFKVSKKTLLLFQASFCDTLHWPGRY